MWKDGKLAKLVGGEADVSLECYSLGRLGIFRFESQLGVGSDVGPRSKVKCLCG